MKYAFDIVGVSPVLDFFTHQQQSWQKSQDLALEYVVSHKCTLDAFIKSVETVPSKWGWEKDEVINSVINFWMNHSESIEYWKSRLIDAGSDNLLVARVADIKALQVEFDSLLQDR
ncbi:hypothetical protein WA1_04460 [Scytonema hofmannii PCC 7110]|uniref:Uncharacterized protein n=1 Tax=Scytonema hofmannii PCC 7110 TaxID=128403 RepID=A0A139WZF8_9CYAN|nr:hypothetical protein [Scytonema hofmannii]KYC37773.1 hypothetical protein WA1_04460 [Scytonema hofmannii PCC 7110]